MTLTPAELAQLAAELAFANVAVSHAERFAAEQRAGIARAEALLDRLDRTLVQQ